MNQVLNNPFFWALISMFTLGGRKLAAGNWKEVRGLPEKGKGSYYSWGTNIGSLARRSMSGEQKTARR